MRLTDHKTVGLRYAGTGVAFLVVGFLLMAFPPDSSSPAAPPLASRPPGGLRADPPAIGIVSETIANNTRRPLWGYRAMVGSAIFIGHVDRGLAHHMFLTGLGTAMSAFFLATNGSAVADEVALIPLLDPRADRAIIECPDQPDPSGRRSRAS